MKNLKTILLILFAIAATILIFFLVKNKTSNNTIENEKIISEIKYIDNKLTYLLNTVNNITLDNYIISNRRHEHRLGNNKK